MAKVLFNRNPAVTTYMHAHGDGTYALEKCFDAEPAIEHAAYMRNEVVQTGELRKAMSVPTALLFEWLRQGKLGEEAFCDGKIVVDRKTLDSLMREFSKFNCVDKL